MAAAVSVRRKLLAVPSLSGGDQRRDIDWRQSAKRDTAFVRQMEWEASQTLWL